MSSRRASVSEAANAIATQMTGRAERESKRLPIAQIRRDGGTQPRAGLDPAVVAEYVEVLRSGGKLPPVEVVYDGTDHWLWDGYHRLAAADEVEETDYEVFIRSGTRRDAVLLSVGANADHGLRRTNEDKRRAVETLLNDGEWAAWSDREIARTCKVSHTFVATLRTELTGNGCQSDGDVEGESAVRRGADGRTIDVSNIQTANQLRAARDALAKLDLPPIDDAWRDTVKRSLFSSIDYLKRVNFGPGDRLRPYLPYALQMELDSDEPRISFVNWLRAELPKWLEERAQEQGRHHAASEELQALILQALEDHGEMRSIELMTALDNPAPDLFRAARNALKDAGLIVETVAPGMRVSYRLADDVSVNSLQIGGDPVPEEPPDLWLDRQANRAPAHSDDHDPDLEKALLLRDDLDKRVMDALDAMAAVLTLQGIRSFHLLDADQLRGLYERLNDLGAQASKVHEYAEMQTARIRLMGRSGQPYDEDGEA